LVNADGSYTFTPTTNFNGGVPTITYTVSDGTATATANLNITVTAVNDAPVANADTKSSAEDVVATGNVISDGTADSDPDSDPVTVTQYTIGGVSYSAGQKALISGVGEITLNANGSYTFTPTTNFNGGVATITYTISDGNGGTATSTLNITVTPVNDPPVALFDTEDTPQNTPVSGNLLTNDSDIDSDKASLTVTTATITGVSTPVTVGSPLEFSEGTFLLNANGTYTFTPTTSFTGGVPTITYTVSDNYPSTAGTSTSTLNLVVTAVPDPPMTATPTIFSTLEDIVLTNNVITGNVTGTTLTPTLTEFKIGDQTYKAGETASISGKGTIMMSSDGSFTFTPYPNFSGSIPTITYTIADSDLDGNDGIATSTLTITVTPVNDAPVALPDVATVLEDTPVSGNVLTNDSDVDSGTLTVTSVT
ncbi:MAG: tandem-95 repeat protein, partial [Bacteroidota bacterium]